jgi:hypothetical protein
VSASGDAVWPSFGYMCYIYACGTMLGNDSAGRCVQCNMCAVLCHAMAVFQGLLWISLQVRPKEEEAIVPAHALAPAFVVVVVPHYPCIATRLINAATYTLDSRNTIVCGFCVRLHSPVDPVLLLPTAHSVSLPCGVSLLPLLMSPPDSSSQGVFRRIAVTIHIARPQPTIATLLITHSPALPCPSSHSCYSSSPQGLRRQQNPV